MQGLGSDLGAEKDLLESVDDSKKDYTQKNAHTAVLTRNETMEDCNGPGCPSGLCMLADHNCKDLELCILRPQWIHHPSRRKMRKYAKSENLPWGNRLSRSAGRAASKVFGSSDRVACHNSTIFNPSS